MTLMIIYRVYRVYSSLNVLIMNRSVIDQRFHVYIGVDFKMSAQELLTI